MQVLGLDNNRIKDWQEVCKLGHLPKLSQLLLSGNSIDEITLKGKAYLSNIPPIILTMGLPHGRYNSSFVPL